MENNQIHFILTGGTIYSATKGQERDALLKHSAVPGYVQSLKPDKPFEFSEVFMKDSRDITNDDRIKILQLIEQSGATKIIITHGTFTMAETGRFLKKDLKRKDQVIILTGAITPLEFKNSDAPFNLEFSIEQSELLPTGVYVAMNGKMFFAEEAIKNEKTGEFYSKLKKK